VRRGVGPCGFLRRRRCLKHLGILPKFAKCAQNFFEIAWATSLWRRQLAPALPIARRSYVLSRVFDAELALRRCLSMSVGRRLSVANLPGAVNFIPPAAHSALFHRYAISHIGFRNCAFVVSHDDELLCLTNRSTCGEAVDVAFIERRIYFRRECRTDSVAPCKSQIASDAVIARSPPLNNETLCSCFPGGLAADFNPAVRGSFSSTSDKSARRRRRAPQTFRGSYRTCENVSANNFLVVELICAITSSNSAREFVRSLFCPSRICSVLRARHTRWTASRLTGPCCRAGS